MHNPKAAIQRMRARRYQNPIESTRLWILLIALASGPWFGVVPRPQWSRVTWLPFHGRDDKPRDMAVNFLMFVPFGWSFVRTRPGARGVMAAMSAAAAVSVAVETPQLFFKLRDPSTTDVVMAVCGSAAGSLASQAFYGRDPRGASRRRETGEPGRAQEQPGRG
jgi:glycopeptide antibiotics resistance protein